MESEFQPGNEDTQYVEKEYFEELTVEDIMGLQWSTEDDAYAFYQKYGLAHGFGTRKDRYKRKRSGELLWRSFVCACEGFRSEKDSNRPDKKRAQRPTTRCGCPATLRIKQNKDLNVWTVNKFVDEHNHPILQCKVAKFHGSHRSIDKVEQAQVNSLHDHKMKTSHISELDFTRKDLYNHFDKQRREDTIGGDAMAALTYFMGRAENDSRFFMKHTVNKEGCLEKLFWADGISRSDYQCFGDVVAFDSTYKKNKYNKPLMIFCGINHHQQSVVFACCLLSDETKDTYKWVLRTLVEAMDGKTPASVVTDGDKALRNAIVEVFPEANHRLCSWHLQQNAQANVKRKEFVKDFGYLATANVDVEEFESRWAKLVDICDLLENEWVKELYSKRHLWASAHLRGKVMCGFTSTSRCEGINLYVESYVNRKYNLLEFIQHIHQALDSIRYNELQADYNSQFGQFVLCTVHGQLERSAADLYTKEAFTMFQMALHEACAWTVDESEDIFGMWVYKVKRYRVSGKRYRIRYDPDLSRQKMQCECGMLESYGLPCPHMLCVMAYEDLDGVLPSVVYKRWTKSVKEAEFQHMSNMGGSSRHNQTDVMKSRMTSLGNSLRWLNYLASERTEDFYAIRDQVHRMIGELELKRANESTTMEESDFDVRDITVLPTSGGLASRTSGISRP